MGGGVADWAPEVTGELAFAVAAGDALDGALEGLLEATSLPLQPANKNGSEIRVTDKATCVLFILWVDRLFKVTAEMVFADPA